MLDVTTPALLFPAISLLMLAYTNRFITLAALARELKDKQTSEPNKNIQLQIRNLAFRINLMRYMQIMGALSFFFCAFSMFSFFLKKAQMGTIMFGIGLASLLVSLAILMVELTVSVRAIRLMLESVEE